jgi:type IV pilus assembly protein PilY1
MKNILRVSLIAGFFVAQISPAFADDSDIFGRNVQPNVMILFDSSGSMSDQVPSQPYDPATTYPTINKCGNPATSACDPVKVYKLNSNKYTVYANTVALVNKTSAQTALNANGSWSGSISGTNYDLFLGNYLNWKLSGNYPATEQKIVIAKRVITNLLNSVEGVAFGVMKFNSSENGAAMVGAIGTSTTTLVTAVNAISANGTTPLGEQIRDAGKYFKGTFSQGSGNYASPITVSCQPNFIIVISDGIYNHPIDPRVEATNRFTQDHATGSAFPGVQNVIVDTIGFGLAQGDIDAGGITVLQQTATNGGGSFYLTNNSAELEDALQQAISQIVAATFTFASPVIPTTSTTGSDKVYTAAFQTDAARPFWRGYLKAYQRGSNGMVPVDANGVPLTSSLVWEAGQLLSTKASSTRTIYTAISGTRQDFTKANTNITMGLLGAASSAERDKIIDFTRGVDSYDEDLDGNLTEDRAWKLGDIYHANPVLVPPPFLPSTDSTFAAFATANASRTTIVLAGANDGMLHAFRESDGAELWAFVAPDFMDTLKNLTARSANHEFFLDSSPIVTDVKISGTWKTIVVFGERRGGNTYHALDITDTTNPSYLWSFTDSKMGETWSEPAIGKVKMSDGSTKFVAFVGGGYDTPQNNNLGKAFFVIDLSNGSKLWEYYNNSSANDRQYMNFSLAANAAAADLDSDGFVNRVYIGDVGGQLWKFDVSAAATVSSGLVTNWTGKRLFAASPGQANPPASGDYYPAQAIYVPPTLTYDDTGNLWVFFGTGDRNHPVNSSANRFYGIKDNTTMTNASNLTESSLVNVTTTYQTSTQGWYMTLASDEKVLASANVFNKVVFFSSFTPTSTISCQGGGGDAKLYACSVTNGYAGVNWANGAPLSSAGGAAGAALSTTDSTRSTSIGTGIASKPVVILGQSGATITASVITATTDQQISSNPAPPPALKRILYWKEIF